MLNKHDEIQVEGHCDPEFSALMDCFTENLRCYGETGAAVTVFHRERVVANIYGSHGSQNGFWQSSHRVCTMSCCKAPLALCLHLLAERGKISLDAAVCEYWPEFAAQGKDQVKVSQVLNHTSGLPSINNVVAGDIFNWQRMVNALSNSKLVFEPGKQLSYHALTFGHLVGELIRRVDGRMPADFFHQEISQPFAIDYDLRHFPEQNIRAINSNSEFKPLTMWFYSRLARVIPHWKMQYFRPCNGDYHPNSTSWKSSEIPAVTGQGSALGLAKMYAFLAGGGCYGGQRLCQQKTVDRLRQLSVAQKEATTGQQWRMGLGFMLNSPEFVRLGPSMNTFGHVGMGGATGFADPDNQLSFAYVTEHYHQPNKQDKSMTGQRLTRLISACYQGLDTPRNKPC